MAHYSERFPGIRSKQLAMAAAKTAFFLQIFLDGEKRRRYYVLCAIMTRYAVSIHFFQEDIYVTKVCAGAVPH
jgi:hypothetical protein